MSAIDKENRAKREMSTVDTEMNRTKEMNTAKIDVSTVDKEVEYYDKRIDEYK